ncbi:alpha/beta fold hydrolase [Oculatella sp. FACHB-28]|uniref:alpha/beta fold hydrolase n=1 Tax=Oculatella sp. FACHB-28 TaxID=2692845 RepID=UPI0016873185|nr:alpha/beta fold hydrolase [Oculatella sp. FACHB-28]MBD2055808.1 alpha/beta fold hydrolase [Oculatella sp. FACHB-28]
MRLTQTPQDQYIKVGDVNTRYWALGDGEATVILLHGLGSCVETWTYNIGALAQHHRVYAIDLVGSGRSDKPPTSYSLVDLAKFVQAFMDVLNLERASLVGNSLGGGIALQFALLFPEQIEKLVLANSLGLGKEITFFLRLASLPWPSQLFRPSRISTASVLKQIVYDSAVITDDWVEVLYQIGNLPGTPEALQRQLRANIDFWGVRPEVYRPIVDQLATIHTPTLIIWGQQDPILPVAHAQFAAEQLPNADLQIFDECGHWSQVERSQEFNAAILNFLQD